MATAIMTQNEVAYNVVMRADLDDEAVNKRIAELKKTIAEGEKRYRPGVNQKIDLLEQKTALINLERQAGQILAEKAMAIRALYFYAGFNPFTPKLTEAPVKDISGNLKVGFNKDVVEMLAKKVPQPETPLKTEKTTGPSRTTGWKNCWKEKTNRRANRSIYGVMSVISIFMKGRSITSARLCSWALTGKRKMRIWTGRC